MADLPVFEPAHQLVFPEARWISLPQFSPDGTRAYFTMDAGAFDVWAYVISLWPEWLGGLAALLLLVAGFAVVRILGRPRRARAPYCRRCNYDLSAHVRPNEAGARPRFVVSAGTLCPECGADATHRPPRVGRCTWRRLAVPLAPAVLGGLLYGVMWASGVPRQGRVSWWVDWTSTRLGVLAEGKQWPHPYVRQVSRILELNLASGSTRVLRSSSRTRFNGVVMSPDGRYLYTTVRPVSERQGWGLGEIRQRLDGVVGVRQLELPGCRVSAELPDATGVLDFWDDGKGVLVYTKLADERDWIAMWSPEAGTVNGVLALEPVVGMTDEGYPPPGFEVSLRRGGDRPRFVSKSPYVYGDSSWDIRVHGDDGEVERQVRLEGAAPIRPLLVTTDGAHALFRDTTMNADIIGLDLETGAKNELSVFEAAIWPLAISRDSTRLAAGMNSNGADAVILRDMAARRWTARLPYSSDFFQAQDVAVASDGSWVGAVLNKTKRRGPLNPLPEMAIVLWRVGDAGSGGKPSS